jgi:hypothetical protein
MEPDGGFARLYPYLGEMGLPFRELKAAAAGCFWELDCETRVVVEKAEASLMRLSGGMARRHLEQMGNALLGNMAEGMS